MWTLVYVIEGYQQIHKILPFISEIMKKSTATLGLDQSRFLTIHSKWDCLWMTDKNCRCDVTHKSWEQESNVVWNQDSHFRSLVPDSHVCHVVWNQDSHVRNQINAKHIHQNCQTIRKSETRVNQRVMHAEGESIMQSIHCVFDAFILIIYNRSVLVITVLYRGKTR